MDEKVACAEKIRPLKNDAMRKSCLMIFTVGSLPGRAAK
jgi:hypothetical protein